MTVADVLLLGFVWVAMGVAVAAVYIEGAEHPTRPIAAALFIGWPLLFAAAPLLSFVWLTWLLIDFCRSATTTDDEVTS